MVTHTNIGGKHPHRNKSYRSKTYRQIDNPSINQPYILPFPSFLLSLPFPLLSLANVPPLPSLLRSYIVKLDH